MATTIEADYLVIGTGAMGMAFIDTMIAESDATVAVVDRYHQPGRRAPGGGGLAETSTLHDVRAAAIWPPHPSSS